MPAWKRERAFEVELFRSNVYSHCFVRRQRRSMIKIQKESMQWSVGRNEENTFPMCFFFLI